MMAKWTFLNGDFVEEEKAVLHHRDLSFQRGYGIFDFFRLIDNEPLFLDDHLDRFYFSASEMRLPVLLNRVELKECIRQLIRKNGCPGTGIRLSLSGGCSDDGFSIGKPVLLLSQRSFSAPSATQQNGVSLLSHSFQRQLPHIKTIDYLTAIWLQPHRLQKGADDILYHNDGFVTECPRSNFFLVTQDGRIVTPSEGVLKGVTRKKVIELAKAKYRVEERPVHLNDIKTAKEAFITSTTKQLLPVARIEEKVFTGRAVSDDLLRMFRSRYNC